MDINFVQEMLPIIWMLIVETFIFSNYSFSAKMHDHF